MSIIGASVMAEERLAQQLVPSITRSTTDVGFTSSRARPFAPVAVPVIRRPHAPADCLERPLALFAGGSASTIIVMINSPVMINSLTR
jgi:hypothetical protein